MSSGFIPCLVLVTALTSTFLPQVRAETDNEPLKTVETIAPPFKYGPWIEMQSSWGERDFKITAEITNDAATQIYGEVKFTDKSGKEKTITFADGADAKFTTGDYIATIKVRLKTGGPTGAGVKLTQR